MAKVKQHGFRDVDVDVYVIEFTEDGGRNHAIVLEGSIAPRGKATHVVIQPPTAEARARASAPTIVVGDEPSVPSQSGSLEMDRWLELANHDPDVAEALMIFGSRPHDWCNLDKVRDIVRRRSDIVGGGWVSDAESKLFRDTANHPVAGVRARHARSDRQPRTDLMASEQSEEFIRRILTGWLGSLSNES